MEKSPEISVIVPVYKVEKYLPQCIDSILAQTLADFELLLVDDGSPDRSGEICEEYARRDKRIRVFHQENAGLSCARNVGLREAKGKYISFVNSDDYVTPDYLCALYDVMQRQQTDRGVVTGSFIRLFPDKEILFNVPELSLTASDTHKLVTDLIDKRIMYACSKLFSRELICSRGIRFVPGVSGLEDMLFMLDYCRYADFVVVRNLHNYCYRVFYSTEALSVRINSYRREVSAYREFFERLKSYQSHFGLMDKDMIKAWQSLTVFFHKVILSVYDKSNRYTQKERIAALQELLQHDKTAIRQYYFPTYLADKIGKYMLLYGGVDVLIVGCAFCRRLDLRRCLDIINKLYGREINEYFISICQNVPSSSW